MTFRREDVSAQPAAPAKPFTRWEQVILIASVVATAIAIPLGPVLAFEFDEPLYCLTLFLLAFFLA